MKNNPIYFIALLSLLFMGAHAHERPVRAGKDYALFFAVENYLYWSNLVYPIDDAEAIAKLLRDDYEFETEVVRDPTLADIFAALGRYNEKMKNAAPDAQLLIFFTGHGYFEESLKEGFFIPKDGKLSDLTQGSYLSFPRLQNQLRANNCRHILLAIDACYSGSFDIALAMKGPPQWGRIDDNSGSREQYIREELQLRSRMFLASGKLTPTPDQSEFASRFQKALLSKGGDDRILSMSELWAELEKARPRPHRSQFEGNEEESNFLFIARADTPPPTDAETRAWQAAQRQHSIEGYEYFLALYPNSVRYKTPADQALYGLREKKAWDLARQQNTKDAYDMFLSVYSYGAYADDAWEAKKKLDGSTVETNQMVLVPGGIFQMGDQFGDGSSDEQPLHSVTLNSFYLGKAEVTKADFAQFVQESGYRTTADKEGTAFGLKNGEWGNHKGLSWKGMGFPQSDNHPVIGISWYDAIEYCNWLSEKQGLQKVFTISGDKVTCNWTAKGYRLPSEAEWEYAARSGGKKYKYSWGNGDPDANIADESVKRQYYYWTIWEGYDDGYVYSSPIRSFRPNELYLYDMTGNVREWCWDLYGADYYMISPPFNPKGPESGFHRVVRGGSWNLHPGSVRATYRFHLSAGDRRNDVGFRLARTF